MRQLGDSPVRNEHRCRTQPRARRIVKQVEEIAQALAGRNSQSIQLAHELGLPRVVLTEAADAGIIDADVYKRQRVDVPADISESDLRELVLAREKVLAATADGIRTVIVRPPSLVNVVPM